ncbi:MAG: glycosyltransferase family 2 protein [Mammaliicoccus vitulinus]
MDNPLVSISCITFNHESFIKDCLEGFLMQETSFEFEILIHDDASTDDTVDIIKLYQEKYPDLIKPIFQTENQYSKGERGISLKYNFPRAKGKYIAMCEGDDYWTDPLKLQKQYDFMEANQDCSICFHASNHINENDSNKDKIHRPLNIPIDHRFEIEDVILGGGGFMTTNSMFFLRKHILEVPQWMKDAPVGDGPLTLVLASRGEVGYQDEVMSTYRKMTRGSWSESQKTMKKRKFHLLAIIQMWKQFNLWTNKKYDKTVKLKLKASRVMLYKFLILSQYNKLFRRPS